MKFIIQYLKQRRMVMIAFILFCAIFAGSFYLYHLPVEAVIYPAILCALTAIVYAVWDLRRIKARHAELMRLRSLSAELMDTLPPADSIESEDYQAIIRMLREEQRLAISSAQEQQTQLIDYYTTWGHQIKTPIAAMRLHLQNEDSPLSRTLSLELMRIEQYVEMLLACLRLGSDSTDYVFREYDLDSIIRPAIRRFSGEFISRRLKLEYQPVEMKVVTDEKWLGFVLEQVLSNALKYTREGGIFIYKEGEATLCIRDTGAGIAAEDLPRIFDKGYTGMNGRTDQKASGLGLHLCKRICNNLGHGISVRSVVHEGTTVLIDLSQKRVDVE